MQSHSEILGLGLQHMHFVGNTVQPIAMALASARQVQEAKISE